MTARPIITGLLATAALGAAAAPALAHNPLVRARPGQGATVRDAPDTIRLTFSEVVPRVLGGRLLRAGSRTNLATRTRINPLNARQVLMSTAADRTGSYTAIVRMLAPDGDRQVVVLRFRVRREPARDASAHDARVVG